MLLAFNTIITKKYKIGFDEKTLPSIMDGYPYRIVHLGDEELNEFRTDENVFSECSHLLVTGSSLSASQGSELVNEHLKENPKDNKFYKYELDNEAQIHQNFLIFKNFINSAKYGG